MSDTLERVKITELPLVEDYEGLFTVGTDGQHRSVKVPIAGVSSPPIIGNDGYWYVYNHQSGTYVKTNYTAVGKSAYQEAVDGGYQGTEQEFMNILAHAALEPIWLTEEEFDALRRSGQIDQTREYRTYEEDQT